MRQLIVIEFVTLDGVMQGLGSPDEDRDGGFAHGGWGAPYGDEVLQAAALEGMQTTSAYLFGRRTYEKMVAFWPQQPDANPMAAHLNATPKYVATRTLDDAQLTWANARVLDGDLAPAVRQVKAEGDGSIAVLGSWRAGPAAHRPRPRRRLPPLPAPAAARQRQAPLRPARPTPAACVCSAWSRPRTGVVMLSYDRR